MAHLLETTPAGTDHQRQAAVIVQQLQAAGWTAPPDPAADIPPLRPAHVAPEDSPGRRAFREARDQLTTRTKS